MSDVPTGQPPQGDPTQPPAPPANPPAPELKFTQADLDKIAGDARQDGRTKAEKELLASLGVTDVEAAKAALQAAKEHADSQKTELERIKEERDRLAAEAEAARQLATTTIVQTRLEGALRDAGLKAERIPLALKLVDLGGLVVEGTDVKGVTEAVEQVKTASPEWFGTPASPPTVGGPPGGQTVDYRNDPEAAKAALAKYGIRR